MHNVELPLMGGYIGDLNEKSALEGAFFIDIRN